MYSGVIQSISKKKLWGKQYIGGENPSWHVSLGRPFGEPLDLGSGVCGFDSRPKYFITFYKEQYMYEIILDEPNGDEPMYITYMAWRKVPLTFAQGFDNLKRVLHSNRGRHQSIQIWRRVRPTLDFVYVAEVQCTDIPSSSKLDDYIHNLIKGV